MSIIPTHLVKKYNLKTTRAETAVLVKQIKSTLTLREKCLFSLIIGNISKKMELFVISSHLSYILLGLPHCREFELTTY